MRVFSLKNGFTLAALLAALFPLFMFALILPHLPPSIPVHFGFSGRPDRWAEPLSAETLLLAALGVIGFVLCKAMHVIVTMPLGGARRGTAETDKLMNTLTLAATALFTSFSLYTQYMMQTAGHTFDLAFYISAPCVVAGMLFVGAAHFMQGGSRRGLAARRSFTVCGALIMLLALIPYMWAFILIGAALAVMMAVPGVYALRAKDGAGQRPAV